MTLKYGQTALAVLVTLLIIITIFPQGGMASSHSDIIESQVETEYNGIGEGDQSIQTVVTFEAQQEIDQFRIDISGASNTFVEYQSIQPSVQGEGVDVNSVSGNGEYVVDNLEPDQALTVEFDAYPSRLDQSEIDAAVIELSAENPRTLDHVTRPVADTSSSPLLELERTRSELSSVEGKLSQMQLFDTVGIIGVLGGILVGVGGVGAAVVFRRKESEWKAEAYAKAADEVRDFQQRVSFNTNSVEQECRETINTIENMVGDTPTNGGSTGVPGGGGDDEDDGNGGDGEDIFS